MSSTPEPPDTSRPADPHPSRAAQIFRSYRFPLAILTGVVIGAIIGIVFGEKAAVIKPIGSLFINMMFTLVVPLVFFSIASAVSGMPSVKRLGKIMGTMLGVFAVTGAIAAIVMVIALAVFKPTEGVQVEMKNPENVDKAGSIGDQLVETVVVDDFTKLLSPDHMLPLIIFAVIVGIATSQIGDKGRPFAAFLTSGSEVFLKFTSIIMYFAPIGLGAYFAALIGDLGSQLVGDYLRAFLVYYPVAIVYFILAFSVYSFLAGGRTGFRRFWGNILEPTAVSLGTSSSVAAIPANLRAGKRIGVPADIRETIVPIGATIHMEGSALSAILKIAFLFAVFQRDFFTPGNILIGIGVALLSGMVMAGIPSGGFIGELMIITLYGFPPAALPIIQIIGTVIDPPATTVNSVGDQASSMLVARALDGKGWMYKRDVVDADGESDEEPQAGAAAGTQPGDAEAGEAAAGSAAPSPNAASAAESSRESR